VLGFRGKVATQWRSMPALRHHDDALHTENCIAKLKLTESLMAVKLLPQEFES
jgi:hypothetical protein